ncbi:TPA: hypothetical protein HA242_06940 [Candidatus Woesearchaeota archaeon]|nr:hypothetical protein [Candidatus Woesearchaeota archaeon]HIG93814.1 hypothetical protein [Candidatus Woesearchaeota archaeon]HIH13430.1 hypothetical protein [Candidatus Woesearchaeota archaeon]
MTMVATRHKNLPETYDVSLRAELNRTLLCWKIFRTQERQSPSVQKGKPFLAPEKNLDLKAEAFFSACKNHEYLPPHLQITVKVISSPHLLSVSVPKEILHCFS